MIDVRVRLHEKKPILRAIKIQIDFEYQRQCVEYLFRAWSKWNLDVISLAGRNKVREL